MNEYNFKIGDKVRISSLGISVCDIDKHLYLENIVGTVTNIEICPPICIHVEWDTDKCVICGESDCSCVIKKYYHRPHEIKHIRKVGQQLIFAFFMKEN